MVVVRDWVSKRVCISYLCMERGASMFSCIYWFGVNKKWNGWLIYIITQTIQNNCILKMWIPDLEGLQIILYIYHFSLSFPSRLCCTVCFVKSTNKLAFWWDNAQFQIMILVRFGSAWFWLVTVLLIVWSRSLLLCSFHKKLRIWWKKSFGWCQTDNPRFSCIMYCYKYYLTRKNLEVNEFSSLRKSTRRKSLVIRSWDLP